MSQDETTIIAEPTAARLALLCLAHLEQEEALLGATLDSLQRVRAALIAGDLQVLTAALEQQAHTARAGEDLRRRRGLLRSELADVLHVDPEAVTVRMLSLRLPRETGVRLARCRQRLKEMAAEVDRVNRGNAALVCHCADFLHRLLVEITGGTAGGERYDPTGRRQAADCGSFIQARG